MNEMTPLKLYETTKDMINRELFTEDNWGDPFSIERNQYQLTITTECICHLLNSIAASLAVIAENSCDDSLDRIADSLDTIARSRCYN